jgi:hypothetical protein
MTTYRDFPWRVGRTYRLKERLDSPDFFFGIDPDKTVAGAAEIEHRIYGLGKITRITNEDFPPEFRTIFVQVNGMIGDDGRHLALATSPYDLRIARTKWKLTGEEVTSAGDKDPTDPASYDEDKNGRYLIENGTLFDLGEDDRDRHFPTRYLVKYTDCYRWRKSSLFGNFRGIRISEADAKRYEAALREKLKSELEKDKERSWK